MENKLDSISQFLKLGKFEYRLYDLGRKLTLLPNDLFQRVEDQSALYPYPFQQKAWLALLFWSEDDNTEPTIWFLQFPIDELGYLKLASRDAFMQELFVHVGNNLQAQQTGQEMQDSLKESAFAFKPRQDRLAIFHAFATVELKQQPSHYYAPTQAYLAGKLGYEQWQFLGLQGIADMIARLHLDNNESLLCDALPQLPITPLISFAENLEHTVVGTTLSLALKQRLAQALEAPEVDALLIAALIRALSSSKEETTRQQMLKQVLPLDAAKEIEVIAAIAGRAWQDITQEERLPHFIQTLAHQQQAAFNVILVDLMGIPDKRELVLKVLRSPQRTPLLSKRIGGFFAEFS
ncbi:MAG: DUF3549 family protein [Cocleimonas sp.]|nr:DUF3549 family protein [Cocleimonas sp.]